ncbi:MAG TPA: insulinase family protein, partial [Rectinemataceae bacterium]|nr:insulinase family protein [Rectinemataceae bacterium]
MSNIADSDQANSTLSSRTTARSGTVISRHAIIALAVLIALFSPISTGVFAQTAPASPLPGSGAPAFFTLPNGMEVILLQLPESESVSLNIVFRGGADVQTSKSAGLFRMLEHVLFRGTASSPGEPEPAGATEALGAAFIGGGAETDRFSLSFVLAPDVLTQGLDTIVYLFSGMRLETAFSDPLTFEEARNASHFDIDQAFSDSSAIFDSAMAKKLFVSAPWRLDVTGADYIVNAATEDSLRSLASTWFVPNNAALIVAGDFPAETIIPMIENAFSSWKKAGDPWKLPQSAFPKPGITRPTLMAYPDPSVNDGEALIEMRYRG